jgi:hypothetical protein
LGSISIKFLRVLAGEYLGDSIGRIAPSRLKVLMWVWVNRSRSTVQEGALVRPSVKEFAAGSWK